MKKTLLSLLVSGILYAETALHNDLIYFKDSANTFLNVVSKITGSNIICDIDLKYDISASFKAGTTSDEIISFLSDSLRKHNYTLQKNGSNSYVVLLEKYATRRVFVSSGNIDNKKEVLNQMGFLIKKRFGRDVFVREDKKK